jgi:hypothetical protein
MSPYLRCDGSPKRVGKRSDERFAHRYGYRRPAIAEVVEEYLACGTLEHGFARVQGVSIAHSTTRIVCDVDSGESGIWVVDNFSGDVR